MEKININNQEKKLLRDIIKTYNDQYLGDLCNVKNFNNFMLILNVFYKGRGKVKRTELINLYREKGKYSNYITIITLVKNQLDKYHSKGVLNLQEEFTFRVLDEKTNTLKKGNNKEQVFELQGEKKWKQLLQIHCQ
ncbi:hypothetical protein H5203_22175 [Pseudoalteromonas sp. SG41-1]|uniref:hypothetical protein n=1 Tax=Pseudoalteromonas sp. SG41-1 TaxID=2760979 RepID=UPI001602C7EC|nr:hypothetical protein [Pseudoalteromonas sp. SG41-1]MBB1508145.1 hypothetical protein [Pseudoalteromonas sp. SG41-1]